MARVKKSRKNDPSYRTKRSNAPDTQLQYTIGRVTPVAPGTSMEIAVPQLLSAQGHRLYRQHGCYSVKINLLDAATQVSEVKVYALANHWYVKRAIQTAKQMYDSAVEDERALATEARWNDFRISSQSGGELLGTHNNAGPFGGGTVVITPTGAEYQYSRIRDSAGSTKDFRLVGASGPGGFNIFDEYDNLGNAARDPTQASPATVGAYDGVTESMDEQNMTDLVIRGNDPPYAPQDLNDRVFVQVGSLYREASGAQRLSTGFFDAPLGFVFLSYTGEGQNPNLQLELKSGKYKGVHMEAY